MVSWNNPHWRLGTNSIGIHNKSSESFACLLERTFHPIHRDHFERSYGRHQTNIDARLGRHPAHSIREPGNGSQLDLRTSEGFLW